MKIERRTVLKGMLASSVGLAALKAPAVHAQATGNDDGGQGDLGDLVDVSIAHLQAAMAAHQTSSREITSGYIERIHRLDPRLHSVIEVNPDALAIAEALDDEQSQRLRSTERLCECRQISRANRSAQVR